MTRWEFRYVDLWLGDSPDLGAVDRAKERIAQLGNEGWEPVGQVRFVYHRPPAGGQIGRDIHVEQLLLKRPHHN
jgi:hypothetical protein